MREVLATAMLEAAGVDTSKSFSLIETGEALYRNDEPSPTRSSVLVRLSHSHIRIGSFQRQRFLKDEGALERLLDHSITHYLPECARETREGRVAAFLEAVCERVARTGAQWVAAGFVHGVLNSDNINITGESFDYGPWRFLPHYDPEFTAAYFDQTGLYAFGRQPDALAWNLTRLAECLVPLGEHAEIERALNTFWPAFQRALPRAYLDRLGLESAGEAEDRKLIEALLTFLGQSQAPYEQVLFDWRGGMESAERAAGSPVAEAYKQEMFAPVREALKGFVPNGAGVAEHPYFARQAPRTMLIEEVEAIWAAIAEDDDWSAFDGALREIAEMREAYGNG